MSRSVPWRALAGAVLGLLALCWACWPAERGTRQWERGTDSATVSYPARSAFRAPTSHFDRPAVAPPSADHRLDRPPSLSAAQIDVILAAYHSPAAGLGPVFYDQGVAAGIDPTYLVAFFVVESAAGTRGVARTTHSLGNIRCTPGYTCQAGYRATRSGNAERGTRGRAPLAEASRPTSAFRVPPSADPAAYAATVTLLVDGWTR